MPAVSHRLYIFPDENGQAAWIMPFPLWWERRAFFKKYGERRIDTGDPIYVDYGLLLTGTEARLWDRHSREAFAGDARGRKARVVAAMGELETRLHTARWVVVESYEWESGLD